MSTQRRNRLFNTMALDDVTRANTMICVANVATKYVGGSDSALDNIRRIPSMTLIKVGFQQGNTDLRFSICQT